MTCRLAVVAVLAFAGGGLSAAQPAGTTTRSDDWPQWRGPNRDGKSTATGLLQEWPAGGPPLAWKADLGGVGYGSPAVVGDRLFVLAAEDANKGANEYALCLDATTGKQRWKASLGNVSGTYNHGWGSGPRSTPTVDGGFVYVLGAMGDLQCLKADDGQKVWGVNLVKEYGGGVPVWGYSESVLIDGDRLVCTPGGKKGSLLALDKRTGQKLWQSDGLTDGAGYAGIIATEVGKVRQYVTQTMQAAVGVRASDGKPLWRVAQLKRSVAVIPTPIVHDNHAFFTTGYGAGCELIKLEPDGPDGTKATVVYTQNKVIANHHGGVILVGDKVYGHSDTKQWVCFDYKAGGDEPEWSSKSLDKGSVTFADGRLYCYGQGKGTAVLAEASPGGWKEHGRMELPEQSKFDRRQGHIWAHPVVAGGKLFLRDHELLFAFDVAAKK